MIEVGTEQDNGQKLLVDFGQIEDKTVDIIKVIGVGGGGCNAVRNMYNDGIAGVTFAVCNTDSKSLASSPVPVKVPLGVTGLGAGANPDAGRKAAEDSIEQVRKLLDDGTKMVFVTAGMGGGTGTGAAPVIAGVAKAKGILTIGIVTIPFYFEKKKKIIKALKGVEEMRKNVDALLIINNERICDIYSDSPMSVKESFRRADEILSNATKSISELITIEGDINLDFCDVETTMRGGGGAIMAIGRSSGEHRVERALIDALDSPLLFGNDIGKAKRILLNIYTSEQSPLLVSEMSEIDGFMNELHPNIEVIWGVSDDNTLGEDAKVTILATGFDDGLQQRGTYDEEGYYEDMIRTLYKPYRPIEPLADVNGEPEAAGEIPFEITTGEDGNVVEYVNEEEKKLAENGAGAGGDVYGKRDDTVWEYDGERKETKDDKGEGEGEHEEDDAVDEPATVPQSGTAAVQWGDNDNNVKKSWGTFQNSFVSRAKAMLKQMTELTQD